MFRCIKIKLKSFVTSKFVSKCFKIYKQPVNYQIKNTNHATSIKDVDGKKGIITGYFSVFNNEDSDGDTILPGAFTKTIGERGPAASQPRIKHLLNHSTYNPIGVLQVLQEDNKGLYYESQPGTHSIGQDVVKMIESGLITEHSIGYEVVRKQVINPDADWRDQKQILQELKLWEGSCLTAWGANEQTGGATLKSLGKEAFVKMLNDRQVALEKFCRNSTATDETIELLLLESKQLTKIILDFSEKSTAPEKTPPSHVASTLPVEMIDALTNFKNSLKN